MASDNQNPYPGPRSFQEEDSRYFFGRDEESRQLASLIISHRAVLFYAPSGAGKTSLLKAKVIPELRERRKVVSLPVTRVGGDLAPGLASDQVHNIYVFNALINLVGSEINPVDLISTTLLDGLQQHLDRAQDEGPKRPHLLILDQFEEMFTFHVGHYEERADFFSQLNEALATLPQMSLLISMREDHIARLDSYAAHLPDRLRTRFRMERLSEIQALAAVEQPAQEASRTFEPGVAQALVDNLRRVQVRPSTDGEVWGKPVLGNFVEPVHLQIVCRRLWQNLPDSQHTIRFEDVHTFGNVDQALTGFYEETIQAVLDQTSIGERQLRVWIDEKLITPARTRGLVYRGESHTEGLPNPAIDILANAYIVRAEVRGGEVWYELAHDRLVEPILDTNDAWYGSHQHPISAAALRWEESDRDPQLLLSGDVLNTTLAFAETNPDELNPLEQEFLQASQQKARADRTRRLQFAVIGTVMLLMLFAALAIWGFSNAAAAQREAAGAKRSLTEARASQRTARVALAYAVSQQETAEAARGELQNTLATQEVFLEAISAELLRIQAAQTAASATAYASAGSTPTPKSTASPAAYLTDTPTVARPTPTVASLLPAVPSPTGVPTLSGEDSSLTLYSAVESQLAGVREAQTRMAETGPVPTQSPVVPCSIPIDGQLNEVVDSSRMGCPTGTAQVVWAAWQPFQGGNMLWRSDTARVSVFYDNNTWLEETDRWDQVSPVPSRGNPPAGLQAPVRGFGYLWSTRDDILNGLGWALSEEKGFCAYLQPFEKGVAFRSSTVQTCDGNQNRANDAGFPYIYIGARNDGTWLSD